MNDQERYMDIHTEELVTKAEYDRLKASNAELLKALKIIAEGAGAFNRDPLEHASNCIDEMKETARAAIAKAKLL